MIHATYIFIFIISWVVEWGVLVNSVRYSSDKFWASATENKDIHTYQNTLPISHYGHHHFKNQSFYFKFPKIYQQIKELYCMIIKFSTMKIFLLLGMIMS